MRKSILLVFAFILMLSFSGCVQSASSLSVGDMQDMSPDKFFQKSGLSEKDGLYIAEPTWSAILDKEGKKYNDAKIFWENRFLEYCKANNGVIEGQYTFISKLYGNEITTIADANALIDNRLDMIVSNWGNIDRICIIDNIPVFGYYIGTKFINITGQGNPWWNYKVQASKIDKNEFNTALKTINFGMSKLIESNKIKQKTKKHLEQEESFRRF
ncbi:MAG: hypothetical protein IE909_08245 [Campylobacterales bacterium]|nr:hypothetical protein [Campylobacterales bacterium]